MGVTKTLLHTVYGGGGEAVAAVERLATDWREMLEQSASEIEELREQSPTLTDAEREAIEWAAYAAEKWYEHAAADTLRGLLKRLSP